MKKTKEILQAEQIVATLLKDYTPKEVLEKAQKYANDFKFQIASRVSTAVKYARDYDTYEGFTEKDILEEYDDYLMYWQSFLKGDEKVFKLMLQINDILGGDFLSDKLVNIIEVKALKEDAEEKSCENCKFHFCCQKYGHISDSVCDIYMIER